MGYQTSTMIANPKQLIAKFGSKRILVVGDVMLDEYIHGRITRMSPEAPTTPVILVRNKTYALGGAANVAHNVTVLGGNAILLGVIGADGNAKILTELLKKGGIRNSTVVSSDRLTTTKTRIFEDHRQLARIDRESTNPLPRRTNAVLASNVRALKRSTIDFVIVSDYAKGVLSKDLMRILTKNFGKEKIIGDIKPRHASLMRGIYAIAPNLKEAAAMSGIKVKNSRDAAAAGTVISRRLHTTVIITMGRYGMLVVPRGKSNTAYKIAPRKIRARDVTGAGDTATAALTLALASGASIREAAEFANRAASLAVAKLGTATVRPAEIANA